MLRSLRPPLLIRLWNIKIKIYVFRWSGAWHQYTGNGYETSIKVYFRKKVTEQYPENRKELKMFDRFRGTLNMPHNENNEHRCVACGLCQMACPNDTIKVTGETIETEDGKRRKSWQNTNMT